MSFSVNSSSSSSSSSAAAVASGGAGDHNDNANANNNYIQHHVSKMDTLAGVAIKYGVEVADIKKMNALVTDLQMFALNYLRIPLPGRHPPSSPSNGFATPGERRVGRTSLRQSQSVESFQSLRLKSTQRRGLQAMSSLQGFYGLKNSAHNSTIEGTELAVYGTDRSHYLEDGALPTPSPASHLPPSRHRKSRSLVDEILPENGEFVEDKLLAEVRDSEVEKSVRRRQRAEADFGFHTPEMLLKEENSGRRGFLAKTGKSLALRPKSSSRTTLPEDANTGWVKPSSVMAGNSHMVNGSIGVRKSCSTSNLQDQDNGDSTSILPSLWSLKPDLQAFSATAIARPIFDGLPKPVTSRKNKAALD